MGFFKNIGKGIKKATKQISIKNAIKLGGQALSTLPGVGSIAGGAILSAQEARENKKALERENMAQNNSALVKFQDDTSSVFNQVAQAGVKSAWQGANQGIKQGTNNVGADIIQGSLIQWFKTRWYIPVAIIALLYFLFKNNTNRTARRSYSRY